MSSGRASQPKPHLERPFARSNQARRVEPWPSLSLRIGYSMRAKRSFLRWKGAVTWSATGTYRHPSSSNVSTEYRSTRSSR